MARARALYRRSLLPLAILATLPAPLASAAEDVDTRRFPKLVRLLLASGGGRSPEGAARREGPPRVPADLLGPARPQLRARPPTSSRTPSAPPGRGPTSSSRTRTRRAPRPAAGRCWRSSAGPRRSAGLDDGRTPVRQPGLRPRGRAGEPETWVYRDRPGRPYTFTRAELSSPSTPSAASRRGASSTRTCGARRRRTSSGPRSTTAAGPTATSCRSPAQRGTAAGALDLLTTPRSDFPLAAETKLVMRGPKGEALVAGLVRFPPPAAGGAAPGARLARGPGRRRERADRGERGAGQPRRPPPPTAPSWRPGACR